MSESQAGDRTASRPTWLEWLIQFLILSILFFINNYLSTYKNYGDDYIHTHDFYISEDDKKKLSEEIAIILDSEDNLTVPKIVGSIVKSFNVGNYTILNSKYIGKKLNNHQTRIVIEHIVKRDVIIPMRACLKSPDNRRRIAEGVIPTCMERLSLGARYGTPENTVNPQPSDGAINRELDRTYDELHRLIEADVSKELYPEIMLDISTISETLQDNLKFNMSYCQNPTSPQMEYEMIQECSGNKGSIDRSIQKINAIGDSLRINTYVVTDYRLDKSMLWAIITSLFYAALAVMIHPALHWLFLRWKNTTISEV